MILVDLVVYGVLVSVRISEGRRRKPGGNFGLPVWGTLRQVRACHSPAENDSVHACYALKINMFIPTRIMFDQKPGKMV